MLSSSSFWHKTGAWLQLITGLIHGTSLFADSQPTNETEKQMVELMRTYIMDMGAGFHRSFEQIFTSISAFMTLSLLFSAAVNFTLIRSELSGKALNNILLINTLYGLAASIVFYFLAFLPPFVCLLLITLAFCSAYFLGRK